MTDYIREAAGIAFWLAGDDEGEYIQIPDEPFSHYLDEPLPQWLLDALAAQLVRQVDAKYMPDPDAYGPTMEVEVSHGCTCINEDSSGYWLQHTGVSGPDRTMNTIKAIVDSGVLE